MRKSSKPSRNRTYRLANNPNRKPRPQLCSFRLLSTKVVPTPSSLPSVSHILDQKHPSSHVSEQLTRAAQSVSSSTKLLPTRLFGHGIDIAYIPRFKDTITNFGDRFYKKALHPSEIAHINSLTSLDDKATYLASRWAFKEAVIKASGKRLLFPEMQMTRVKGGADPRPALRVEGYALHYFTALNLIAEVTISHDRDYALASVIFHQYEPFVNVETFNLAERDQKRISTPISSFDT